MQLIEAIQNQRWSKAKAILNEEHDTEHFLQMLLTAIDEVYVTCLYMYSCHCSCKIVHSMEEHLCTLLLFMRILNLSLKC